MLFKANGVDNKCANLWWEKQSEVGKKKVSPSPSHTEPGINRENPRHLLSRDLYLSSSQLGRGGGDDMVKKEKAPQFSFPATANVPVWAGTAASTGGLMRPSRARSVKRRACLLRLSLFLSHTHTHTHPRDPIPTHERPQPPLV